MIQALARWNTFEICGKIYCELCNRGNRCNRSVNRKTRNRFFFFAISILANKQPWALKSQFNRVT